MHKISEQRNIQYNLRSQTDFQLRSVKGVNCGVRAFRYLGPNIWNIVSLEIKYSETLEQFKMKIKSWKPPHCPCNLCQPYFHCTGYICIYKFLDAFINFCMTISLYIHFFPGLNCPLLCDLYF